MKPGTLLRYRKSTEDCEWEYGIVISDVFKSLNSEGYDAVKVFWPDDPYTVTDGFSEENVSIILSDNIEYSYIEVVSEP